MATSEAGIHYPQATDSFAPHADMKGLVDTLAGRVIIPVANATERDDVYTALISNGDVASGDPVFVYRDDANTGREVEYSTDGSTWRTIAAGGAAYGVFSRTSSTTINSASVGWETLTTVAQSGGLGTSSGQITLPYSSNWMVNASVELSLPAGTLGTNRGIAINGRYLVNVPPRTAGATRISTSRFIHSTSSNITGSILADALLFATNLYVEVFEVP